MFFEPQRSSLGLDLSDRSLKAVQLRRTLAGQLTLAGLAAIEVPAGVFEEGELKDPTWLASLISELLTHPQLGAFSASYVVACLPETKTFIKMIDIPPMPAEETSQAIRWEAEHHIPIPIEDTYWDWQKIGEPAGPNGRWPVLLGVVPKGIVDSYTQALVLAKLVPVALEIEAVAITRALLPLGQAADPSDTATVIIDLGASRTSLIVVDHKVIQFTVSLPVSGRGITESIATNLKLTESQAEQAKILCGLDPKKCKGIIGEILGTVIDELLSRIREAIVFYREHFPGSHEVDRIMLCGGGSNFKLIDQHLERSLKLSVHRGNPWCNLEPSSAPLKPGELIGYTTAIGLALRNFTVKPSYD